MRAQWMKRWWLVAGTLLTSMLLLSACQMDPVFTANSAVLEVKGPAAPESAQRTSGVQLRAHMGGRPYAGEFVITELNGAEVTRVTTNQDGQATVNLPPGQYLLGVRTEEIYPLAAPAAVNILSNRYVSVDMSLVAGIQQSQSQ